MDIEDFKNREYYFISGFRGTGKTSLLRYVISVIQEDNDLRSIVLFKSDIGEEKKLQISSHVGAEIATTDSGRMGIAQDFKSAWSWFVLHQIATLLLRNSASVENGSSLEKFIRLMGLSAQSPFKRVLGFLPKIEGAKVRISADLAFFETELNLDLEPQAHTTTVLFSDLVAGALQALSELRLTKSLAIGIDELEVFFLNREQYERDLAMVRDLIFAVDRVNAKFRASKIPIYVIAAIRREVVDAIGTLGEEVNRVVHDRGVGLSWHHSPKSLSHPLIEMIRRKIRRSLPPDYNGDPIEDFFDSNIDGETIETYLLDRSFYRPRDIMWRLTFAQKAFPNDAKFGKNSLVGTETQYSSQLWNEVEYELSATFSPGEVSAINSIFSGVKRLFFIKDLHDIAKQKSEYSNNVASFIEKNSISDVCDILYSHGALGNDFRTGPTGNVSRHRWIFRGDPKLINDQRMTVNPALRKALAAIDQRRRGTAGRAKSPSSSADS